jgi:glycerol kinase
VVFLPALVGLGAPHWCSEARGAISGLSLGTRPAHIARATLEAIALQIADVVAATEADLALVVPQIAVDGGATRNALLMQLLADLTDRPVVRPHVAEASALGVARLAAEAIGLGTTRLHGAPADRVMPTMATQERQRIKAQWQAAVASAVRLTKTTDITEHKPKLREAQAGR